MISAVQAADAAPTAVVAIPARDEAGRIGACLAALATQRDGVGRPLPAGAFAVLVYANNCRDGTAEEARRWAGLSPHPIAVVSATVPAAGSGAGLARRRAMDLAAARLAPDGLLLTTDADSCVAPDWVAATLRAFAAGADAVAGYVDAHPAELVGLGPAFLRRSRLEDHYLRCIAEIEALCDPRPHDPWPNHRVSSGASLAVTLAAYRAVGGVPEVALGEDVALTRALERGGFKVRRAMDVVVSTSCRFDSLVDGGAAATMHARHADPDLPCGDEIAPASLVLRRTIARARLRRLGARGAAVPAAWSRRLGLSPRRLQDLADRAIDLPFVDLWERVVAASPVLAPRITLRPSQLSPEIGRAEAILRRLRAVSQGASSRSSR